MDSNCLIQLGGSQTTNDGLHSAETNKDKNINIVFFSSSFESVCRVNGAGIYYPQGLNMRTCQHLMLQSSKLGQV